MLGARRSAAERGKKNSEVPEIEACQLRYRSRSGQSWDEVGSRIGKENLLGWLDGDAAVGS
jgi:hypothetical protein